MKNRQKVTLDGCITCLFILVFMIATCAITLLWWTF